MRLGRSLDVRLALVNVTRGAPSDKAVNFTPWSVRSKVELQPCGQIIRPWHSFAVGQIVVQGFPIANTESLHSVDVPVLSVSAVFPFPCSTFSPVRRLIHCSSFEGQF